MFLWLDRLLKWAVRTFYGVEVFGAENVPDTGSALLVSNHVSYVDAAIICSVMKRRVRFLMWRALYNLPVLGHIARRYGALPVSAGDNAGAMRKALDAAVDALKSGEIVCLFPEGSMTRTAHLQPFQRGFELIARRSGTRVIPIHLDRLWGSIFSFAQGRYFLKFPQLFGRPVRVTIGEPLPPDVDRETVREKIMELEIAAYEGRKAYQRPLHAAFLRNARRAWFWPCMADTSGRRFTWGGALARALALGAWARRRDPERLMGIMLPPSTDAALANVAVAMAGKAAVNLNYTTSHVTLNEIIRRARLRAVLTSRAIVRNFGFEAREEFVFIEDVWREIGRLPIAGRYLLAAILPARLTERWLMKRSDMDALAAVMYTSGATGLPKGVMLSHHSIASNIESATDAMRLDWRDKIAGVMPPFHAFGLTVTVWLPLVSRIGVAYHPNPLDAKGVGRLVEKHRATMLIATPTLCAIYARGILAPQFASLRYAVAGGQDLPPGVARAFRNRFHLDLHEGYGCTELSPVVAVNVPDVRLRAFKQVTAREGSVGRPLPGILVRIVDPLTHEPLGPERDGLVLVRGPSVMRGYMDDPRGTALAIRQGWYHTRDVGMLDKDGFLFIHGRITRLSKIAGETVQHAVVEEAIERADEGGGRRFVVVSLPHPTHGQRLGVVYEGAPMDPAPLCDRLGRSALPNLWIPRPRDFFQMESLPRTSGGQLDYDAARRYAEEREVERSGRQGRRY